jgi:hypothetical protein
MVIIIFAAQGIKPDPKKIDVIKTMKFIQSASGQVKSLLYNGAICISIFTDYARITTHYKT